MENYDFARKFEKTVEAFWENPKTSIYLSSYWNNDFEKELYYILLTIGKTTKQVTKKVHHLTF
jgi:hypothetical protein